MDKKPCNSQDPEVRKGPWTMEEDLILINYIANHGEGVWNSLAKSAGLKRTGKSCRLRWLNYLRPDVRRGNITPQEQLLIMEMHAKLGNRWSKIAKHLPGRTDNEIKNYWRTRIQKHVKQAETFGASQGLEQNKIDPTSTSQIPSPTDQYPTVHNSYSPISCPGYDQPRTSHVSTAGDIQNQTVENCSSLSYPDNFPPPFPTESNDSIWSMEEFWSMPLLNAD